VARNSLGASGGTIGSFATSNGGPVYTDDVLVYTPPARVRSAYVGESRKTLVFTFESLTAQDTTVSAVASHPAVVLDGGGPVQLGSPAPIRGAEFVLYPLPFAVPEGSSLSATAAENWVSTAVGPVGPLAGMAVETGETPMFERVDAGPKTMAVGINIRGPEYWSVVPIYTNLAKQAHHGTSTETGTPAFAVDADRYLTSLSGGTVNFLTHASVASGVGSPDRGHVNLGAGAITVMWDGPDQVSMVGSRNTLTQTSYTRTQAEDNVRVYQNTRHGYDFASSTRTILDGPGVRNLRVYGPGVPEGWASRFHPEFMKKAQGAAVVRLMNAQKTNNSNITSFDQFTQESRRTYAGVIQSKARDIVAVGPYTGPAGYFMSGRQPFNCTTSVPHGFLTGEVIEFSTFPGGLSYVGGGSTGIPAGHLAQILVLSDTEFAACIYTGVAVREVAPAARAARGAVAVPAMPPLAHMAEMCDELDADPWISVPHALDDAGVRQMAALFAEKVPLRQKLYVEYSNECWNTQIGFLQTEYCHGRGSLEGLSGPRWYAKRTAQIHAIFAEEFANLGRPITDVVHVYGTQSGATGVASTIVSYAKSQGYRLDALAGAPYFGVKPTGFAATYDAMDVEQVMDVSALAVAHYPYDEMVANRDILRAYYPDARLVCYEGGMEKGVPNFVNLPAAAAKSRAWSRHPRILEQTLRYLQNVQDAGCDLFCYFELNMYHGNAGSLTYGATWGIYPAAWNMDDGLGDGSDGKFDNRTGYDQLDQIVSVKSTAIRRWYGWMPARDRVVGPVEQGRPARPSRITPGQMSRLRGRPR
jgi:hypothetical protein